MANQQPNFQNMANAFATIGHEMAAMPNLPVVNQGQILQDIQRTIRRGFRRLRGEVRRGFRRLRREVRRDLARLYVDASCIQLFKDEVANTSGS